MADVVCGLLGAVLGLMLWLGGRRQGRQEAEKRTPAAAPQPDEAQRRALEQAFAEQMNFLNFEGDEMRPARFSGSVGQQ